MQPREAGGPHAFCKCVSSLSEPASRGTGTRRSRLARGVRYGTTRIDIRVIGDQPARAQLVVTGRSFRRFAQKLWPDGLLPEVSRRHAECGRANGGACIKWAVGLRFGLFQPLITARGRRQRSRCLHAHPSLKRNTVFRILVLMLAGLVNPTGSQSRARNLTRPISMTRASVMPLAAMRGRASFAMP